MRRKSSSWVLLLASFLSACTAPSRGAESLLSRDSLLVIGYLVDSVPISCCEKRICLVLIVMYPAETNAL